MSSFLSIVLALLWGQLSTYLFFRGWMSFLGIIYCGVGILRRRDQLVPIMRISFSKFTDIIFFWILLFMGFYLLYFHLDLGKTGAEITIFLISASVRMLMVIPRISATIDRFMKEVDDACAEPNKPDRNHK